MVERLQHPTLALAKDAGTLRLEITNPRRDPLGLLDLLSPEPQLQDDCSLAGRRDKCSARYRLLIVWFNGLEGSIV